MKTRDRDKRFSRLSPQPTTLYKVVGPDRSSAIAHSRYARTYTKGATITAIPNTLGLLCFTTQRHAHMFQTQLQHWAPPHLGPKYTIITVKPLTPVRWVEWVANTLTGNNYAAWFMGNHALFATGPAPRGTVSVHRVKVLT